VSPSRPEQPAVAEQAGRVLALRVAPLSRWTRWLLAGGYLLIACLMAASFAVHAGGVSKVQLFGDMDAAGPSLIIVVTAWVGIAVGLARGQSWALLFSILAFPVAAIAAPIIGPGGGGIPLAASSADPGWWPLLTRVPLQVLTQPLFETARDWAWTGSPWAWAAWTLHVVLCVPQVLLLVKDVRVRRVAASRMRARRRVLRPPDEATSLYERNAFQVLGLLAHEASTTTIMRRRDELLTLVESRMPVEGHLDGYHRVGWGGSVTLDRTEISGAVARLQDEPDRLREELLWFRLEGEGAPVLAALRAGNLDEAERTWRQRRASAPSPYERAQALHNLAVLRHARVVAHERAAAATARSGDRDAWHACLLLWSEVIATPECWEHFERRRRRARDQRVDARFVQELRASLAARVLGVHVQLIEAAETQGFLEYARAHVRLIEESKLPVEAKDAALERLFTERVRKARHLLKPLILQSESLVSAVDLARLEKEYRSIRESMTRLGGATRLRSLAHDAVSAARERLRNEVNGAHSRFMEADRECFEGIKHLIDVWNEFTREYNRLPAGLDAQAQAGRRLVHRKMQEKQATVDGLAKQLDELTKACATAKQVLDFLEYVAQDVGTALKPEIDKDRTYVEKAESHAREEHRQTREHYRRNTSGMAGNLGG
jgi:hypothetical protein